MKRKKERQWLWLLWVALLGLQILFMDRRLRSFVPERFAPEESAPEQELTDAAGTGMRDMEDAQVRAMEFGRNGFAAVLEWAQEYGEEPGEALAIWMSGLGYNLGGIAPGQLSRQYYEKRKEELAQGLADEQEPEYRRRYEQAREIYAGLAADLQVFPIPRNSDSACAFPTFSNDWGNPRTFGGERQHEGCDIMGDQYEDGTYPVLSMTDGVVEKLGWLKLGGWRVGIRSDHGIYYYYAHLAAYADGLAVGDRVRAGDLLGYMGSTGYSTVEGTSGNFAVHLHVGIYVPVEGQEDLSVNPYYLMRYLENGHVVTTAYPFVARGGTEDKTDGTK